MTASSMWIGALIIGEASTSSTVIGVPWKIAVGLSCALARDRTAISASSSAVVP